jgi:hypothetical protein
LSPPELGPSIADANTSSVVSLRKVCLVDFFWGMGGVGGKDFSTAVTKSLPGESLKLDLLIRGGAKSEDDLSGDPELE